MEKSFEDHWKNLFLPINWHREERKAIIEHELKVAYAKNAAKMIDRVAWKHCHGCDLVWEDGILHDHPSKEEHDVCQMMEPVDRVSLCFEEALQMVTEEDVIRDWMEVLKKVVPPVQPEEFGELTSKEYRWNTMMDDTWMTQVEHLSAFEY